ncbi:DNA/RNA non-specific endonuclease [Mesorhizobium sp. LjNodule214]|uniref:DNA/RNA non-specific endonuclease n=1 Tax=Mesorhizobium sp. LjNodule214 TaxID=3342252 RepID=UPI003ECE4078
MPERKKGFDTLEALRRAHLDFIKQASELKATTEGLRANQVRAFLTEASQIGTHLSEEAQREAAQRILDYWGAELLGCPDVSTKDFKPTRLAELAEDGNEVGMAVTPSFGADSAGQSGSPPARQVIRLLAQSRQWRDTGEAEGYLLTGTALREAARYRHQDPDIDRFVAASEVSEQAAIKRASRTKNYVLAGLAAICIVLSLMSTSTYYLWFKESAARRIAEERRVVAEQQTRLAEDASTEAKRQKAIADAEAKASEQLRQKAEKLYAQAQADDKAMNDRLVELENKQRNLDAAMAFIREQLRLGKIFSADLPPAIKAAIQPPEISDVYSDPGALSGYDPMFLGTAVSLPVLSDVNINAAFDKGKPLNYINYSLVLNRERRMAFYTAVNLNREQRLVLSGGPSRFYPDPRVASVERNIQADPLWFSTDIARGHLATRDEIAWGPEFRGDDTTTAQRLADVVDVDTNVTPQFDTFNQGAWEGLERWTLTQHNPTARQVTIFSGPVLSDDDPIIGKVQMPRRFWKIAVSAKPTPFQDKSSLELVADAFLLSQFRDGDDNKVDRPKGLPDVNLYRVSVSEIERLTGLSFDAVIHAADQAEIPIIAATAGDLLAKEVLLLDGPAPELRKAITQKIVDAIRDQQLAEPEQKKVLTALLDMASDEAMQQVTPAGRVNLLFVLSQIPAESWSRPGWIDLMAQGRRAVADLEGSAASGDIEIGPQASDYLEQLKEDLNLDNSPTQRVLFQFAGMTREAAVGISEALRKLGWHIPGEERTSEAAGQNEVSYNPRSKNDRAAAELLAADLRAAGHTGVCCSSPNALIKPGTIEVWLSK